MAPESERREGINRADVEISVDLSTLGIYYLSRIINLSSGGAFICHPEIEPIGTILKISFTLPNDPTPIETKAQVTWSYKQAGKVKPSSTGMGIKFIEIQDDDRKKIQDFVEELAANERTHTRKKI